MSPGIDLESAGRLRHVLGQSRADVPGCRDGPLSSPFRFFQARHAPRFERDEPRVVLDEMKTGLRIDREYRIRIEAMQSPLLDPEDLRIFDPRRNRRSGR